MYSQPIDWRSLIATAGGRAGRTQSWIAVGVLATTSGLCEAVSSSAIKLLTFWIVYPILLASGAFVISKRLHDRGRSGWWAAMVLFAALVVWPEPHLAAGFISLPVLIWAFVELGILPGEQGANRFGPNPLKLRAVSPR